MPEISKVAAAKRRKKGNTTKIKKQAKSTTSGASTAAHHTPVHASAPNGKSLSKDSLEILEGHPYSNVQILLLFFSFSHAHTYDNKR